MDPKPIDRTFIKRQFLDVPYGTQSAAQKIDIYLPNAGTGPYPVLFHIHGGAFKMCDKADGQVDPYLLYALERGYAVTSANYRMSGEAKFPTAVCDLKAAVRFLRAHADKYVIDSQHIYSVGGSAGGNLTLMLCTTSGKNLYEDDSIGNGKESSAVQGGVAWFSPTDFLRMDEFLAKNGLGPCDHNQADSPESEYIGGQITQVPHEIVQCANPMTYITDDMPPLFLEHGRRDHLVPYQESELFVEKARRVAPHARVEFEILETADHADPQFGTKENMKKVLDFVDSLVK
jgi:acetyl esterase/lipase